MFASFLYVWTLIQFDENVIIKIIYVKAFVLAMTASKWLVNRPKIRSKKDDKKDNNKQQMHRCEIDVDYQAQSIVMIMVIVLLYVLQLTIAK